MALTNIKCQHAKPEAKKYKLFDGKGLYLEVRPTLNTDRWSKGYTYKTLKGMELNIFPFIGDRSIKEITPPELLSECLRRIEKRGSLDIAGRTRQICSQIFRYAIQTGRCDWNAASDLKGALKTKRTEHFRSMNLSDLPHLITALERNEARLFERTRRAVWLSLAVTDFEISILTPLKVFLAGHITSNPLNLGFIRALQSATKKQANLIETNNSLNYFGIDTSRYIETANPEDEKFGLNALLVEINSKKKEVDYNKIQPYFEEVFLELFDQSFDNLDKISIEQLESKRKFLEWKLTIQRNETIQNLKEKYNKDKARYDDAKSISSQIAGLHKL